MRELEPEAVEAVLKAERETCNHPQAIGRIVLENTALYNENFLNGLHYDSEGRYIDGSW